MSITSSEHGVHQRRQTGYRIPVYCGKMVVYNDPSRGPLLAQVVGIQHIELEVSFPSLSSTMISADPVQS